VIDYLPYNIDPSYLKPVTVSLKGWAEDLTGIDNKSKLPQTLLEYIQFIEKTVEIPISIVSVGPDRTQTIRMK
jgi:adenylosuccinate synthase